MNLHPSSAPVILVVLCALSACGGAPAAGGPAAISPPMASPEPFAALDGRSFEVVLEIPGEAAVKDTLRFAGGQFESTACTTLGFPEWSRYTTRPNGDGIEFHVMAKHPSGTAMDWTGRVKGGAVEGVANRTMNGKTDVLTFKGDLRS